jgi:hypothetical protein
VVVLLLSLSLAMDTGEFDNGGSSGGSGGLAGQWQRRRWQWWMIETAFNGSGGRGVDGSVCI